MSEPTNDQDQGNHHFETTTTSRREGKGRPRIEDNFFFNAPYSYSLLFFLKRSAVARGNLQITTRRRYVRALYIHTHTHTYIHINCFSRYIHAPKKIDLKGDSLATGMSEITSSDSFFAQPFMVEIIKLVAGVIFWEIQFVLSKFFLNVLPENSEKEKLFKRTAPSYCVSTVHATFLTWGGVKIICALYNAPQNEQVILYESTDGSFVAFCEFISVAFLSYMIQDFFHVVHLFPDLGGIDIVIHHMLFFVAGFSAYIYGGYPLMLGYLTICEGSTPFLNMRWFIKSCKEMEYTLPIVDYIAQTVGMKYRGLPAGNRLEYHISTVFSYVFIFVRVIMFGHGILLLLPRFGKGEDKIIPSFVRGILLVLIFGGFTLNLIWVVKIRGMLKYYRAKWFDKPEDNQQNRID